MHVYALLAFYDEPPKLLTRLVEALVAAGVDGLIALDGAYEAFPGGKNRSPQEQHDALIRGCRMPVLIRYPGEVWANNEREKRTELFRLGHENAKAGDDWLWVIDADEYPLPGGEWREQLKQTDHTVGSLLAREPGTPWRLERRLFRAHPSGIVVNRSHFDYRDGDDNRLWGPNQVPSVRLDLRVEHTPRMRPEPRLLARKRYYDIRQELRLEPQVF